MMINWKEFSTLKKIFYITSLVSAIGLAVMILTGMVIISDILAWKWELIKRCPWCM